jgi:hypothetical protein
MVQARPRWKGADRASRDQCNITDAHEHDGDVVVAPQLVGTIDYAPGGKTEVRLLRQNRREIVDRTTSMVAVSK